MTFSVKAVKNNAQHAYVERFLSIRPNYGAGHKFADWSQMVTLISML
ncbi:hypothetical protein [Vibrio neptunius]|nr:hypothetical protein [Vibrio neptunius]MBN3575628.1 hypothetical protein [Vibrio neptunius]QXX05873.1 hypothetical protein KW548_11985 [Vibrio neptunius]